jgi:hypothetical protein
MRPEAAHGKGQRRESYQQRWFHGGGHGVVISHRCADRGRREQGG